MHRGLYRLNNIVFNFELLLECTELCLVHITNVNFVEQYYINYVLINHHITGKR